MRAACRGQARPFRLAASARHAAAVHPAGHQEAVRRHRDGPDAALHREVAAVCQATLVAGAAASRVEPPAQRWVRAMAALEWPRAAPAGSAAQVPAGSPVQRQEAAASGGRAHAAPREGATANAAAGPRPEAVVVSDVTAERPEAPRAAAGEPAAAARRAGEAAAVVEGPAAALRPAAEEAEAVQGAVRPRAAEVPAGRPDAEARLAARRRDLGAAAALAAADHAAAASVDHRDRPRPPDHPALAR
ncbi:hypothetical protein SSBR45G_19170 [Bradyrhizobium sp. SSBR45G]|nr:hypothetical protein SSBR45G_19170 [Bradyrhizobium sp. SSBR45G]GLH83767.1 hypothetical protein SSBR45R_12270 [Bradyrhizobium sp. SSBR45R]